MDDKMKCVICDGTGWVCEGHGNHPWSGASTRRDACGEGPGMPCPAVDCENSMANPDKLASMSKRILDQDAEIEMYRKTLRDIVRQCNNFGYGSPTVMERMIDRIEDMAIDALDKQSNSRCTCIRTNGEACSNCKT